MKTIVQQFISLVATEVISTSMYLELTNMIREVRLQILHLLQLEKLIPLFLINMK